MSHVRLNSRKHLIVALLILLSTSLVVWLLVSRAVQNNVVVSRQDPEVSMVEDDSDLAEVATETPASTEKPAEEVTPAPTVIEEVVASNTFTIAGSKIVDPDGNVFTPIGINASSPIKTTQGWEYIQSYYGENISGKLKAVQAWNWNIIRLTIHCANSTLTAGSVTQAEVLRAVRVVVEEFTPHKIVIMPDCHDVTGKNPVATTAILNEIDAFWTALAKEHSDNPYVWYNYLNEPQTFEQPDSIWYPLANRGYDHLRSVASNSVIVLDLPNQANRIESSYSTEGKAFLKQKCNVMYGWHAYGIVPPGENLQNDTFETSLADHRSVLSKLKSSQTPVLIGEMGHDWNETRQETNWNFNAERNGARSIIALNSEYGLGGLYWHGTGNSNRDMIYGLKQSDDLIFSKPTAASSLSTTGQLFWDMSHPGPSTQAYTGSLDQYGCNN